MVSYLVPCPTWRVSYRLVAEAATPDEPATSAESDREDRRGELLLQGWGLFDNRLEEDLNDVNVRLVAGQPISFIYDLTTSRIPQRPVVQDEARIASGPVQFDEALPPMPGGFLWCGGHADVSPCSRQWRLYGAGDGKTRLFAAGNSPEPASRVQR